MALGFAAEPCQPAYGTLKDPLIEQPARSPSLLDELRSLFRAGMAKSSRRRALLDRLRYNRGLTEPGGATCGGAILKAELRPAVVSAANSGMPEIAPAVRLAVGGEARDGPRPVSVAG
jgi:hypothetical protein